VNWWTRLPKPSKTDSPDDSPGAFEAVAGGLISCLEIGLEFQFVRFILAGSSVILKYAKDELP
jgi:hypothetical protein